MAERRTVYHRKGRRAGGEVCTAKCKLKYTDHPCNGVRRKESSATSAPSAGGDGEGGLKGGDLWDLWHRQNNRGRREGLAISDLSERDEIDAGRARDTSRARMLREWKQECWRRLQQRGRGKEDASSSRPRDGAGAMGPQCVRALQGIHQGDTCKPSYRHGIHRAVHQLSVLQGNNHGKTRMKDKLDDINKGFPEISGSLRKIKKDVMTITYM
jgi:hypothetical protein